MYNGQTLKHVRIFDSIKVLVLFIQSICFQQGTAGTGCIELFVNSKTVLIFCYLSISPWNVTQVKGFFLTGYSNFHTYSISMKSFIMYVNEM